MILLLSGKDDIHINCISREIQDLGVYTKIIDTSNFPVSSTAIYSLSKEHSRFIWSMLGEEILSSEVKMAWYRKARNAVVSSDLSDEAASLATVESNTFIQGTWSLFDCFWINHPYTISCSENKLLQLKIAKECGLIIPDTLITNDANEARTFYHKHFGAIIVKPLIRSWFVTSGNDDLELAIYTNKVESNHLDFLDDLVYCPSILQSYIPKKFELRITVMFDEYICCSIDSQRSERTRHDWRRYDLDNTPHAIVEIPSFVLVKLQMLMKKLGIFHGAIDMIVTPDDEYVFLEVNPSGQWLWIEEVTEYPITRYLAQSIVKKYNSTK